MGPNQGVVRGVKPNKLGRGQVMSVLMRYAMSMALVNLGVPLAADAHTGDRIYPIPELTDEMLARIDLKDVSVQDWIDVLGEPVLTALDFETDIGSYNPADMDFRIWLAWHDESDKLFVAGQFADDATQVMDSIYENGRIIPRALTIDSVSLFVDGDHSGPPYGGRGGFRQGTWYLATPFLVEDPDVFFPADEPHWASSPPYCDGGGGVFNESPIIWIIEFLVTPFDVFGWDEDSPDGSIASTLEAGEVIGLSIEVLDYDGLGVKDLTIFALSGVHWLQGDLLLDGLLLGAGETLDDGSVVEADSWARIKASLAE